MDRKQLEATLQSMGIAVKNGKVRKADLALALKTPDWIAPAKVKAYTISVLTSLGSCDTYVEVTNKGGKKQSQNLTLRFDKGAAASLRGYPNNWAVHDLSQDDYDSDSPKYEELAEDSFMPEYINVYVSAETEKEIYRQLKASLEKQFKDPMFKDHLSQADRKKALKMLDKAIG